MAWFPVLSSTVGAMTLCPAHVMGLTIAAPWGDSRRPPSPTLGSSWCAKLFTVTHFHALLFPSLHSRAYRGGFCES